MESQLEQTVHQSSERLAITIVMPVYNDWESMTVLLQEINDVLADTGLRIDVIVVDDCSLRPATEILFQAKAISTISIVRLAANVGHQRAIAAGLVDVAVNETRPDLVAVMDSDGEDTPAELRRLLAKAAENPGIGIVAQRRKRSESLNFRFFYGIYIRVFRLLTGYRINFGNFVVLPIAHVDRLIHTPNLWNNFAAAVVHSRLPINYVPTARGKRYFGQSKMNFVSLMAHGLGAMAVFSDTVFIRILIASLIILVVSLGAAATAVGIRLLTDLAMPGWTTNALGFTLLASMQAVLLPVMMAFLLLNNRSLIQTMPKDYTPKLIMDRRTFVSSGAVDPVQYPASVREEAAR